MYLTPYKMLVHVLGTCQTPEVIVNGKTLPLRRLGNFTSELCFDNNLVTDIAATILAEYLPFNDVAQLCRPLVNRILQKCPLVGEWKGDHAPLSYKFDLHFQGFLQAHGQLAKALDPIIEGDEKIGASCRYAYLEEGAAVFLDEVGGKFQLTVCAGIDRADQEIANTVDPWMQAIGLTMPRADIIDMLQRAIDHGSAS